MVPSFAHHAASPRAEVADLLLAAAGEFHEVDIRGADARLEKLAADIPLCLLRSADPEDHAEAILALFHRSGGLRIAGRVSPRDALLDSVLARRAGHPLLLAAICSELGRRAGTCVVPVRGEGAVFLGIRVGERRVLVDLSGACSCPPRRPVWMCAHEVAFEALGELSRLLAMHGRLEEAIRAAELRSALPLVDEIKERIAFEVGALRAQLN